MDDFALHLFILGVFNLCLVAVNLVCHVRANHKVGCVHRLLRVGPTGITFALGLKSKIIGLMFVLCIFDSVGSPSLPRRNFYEHSRSLLSRRKTALVTGSAAGLGAAIALALAEADADVITHGNRRSADVTSKAIASIGRKRPRSQPTVLRYPGVVHGHLILRFGDLPRELGAILILAKTANATERFDR